VHRTFLIPRCPNEAAAVEVLKEALALAGLDSMDVPIVMITSQADADQSGSVCTRVAKRPLAPRRQRS
jgi:hypothetical protein